MFDLFADTLSAVNQVAAFMGALACWGLGGAGPARHSLGQRDP